MNVDLMKMQTAVQESGLDGWLIYDFRGNNFHAWQMLHLPPDTHSTRRWMVFLPAHGEPTKLVHRMEHYPLANIKATQVLYDTHESWHAAIAALIKPDMTIAMEYSPNGALPVVSTVDAGTLELVRSTGATIVSSADLLQQFTAVLTVEELATAAVTAGQLRDGVMEGFAMLRKRILADEIVTEYDVQQHVVQALVDKGLTMDHHPIVAIGPNAANPHYAPTYSESAVITRNMTVVIDAWAKRDAPGSVYADITWVGYTGETVPSDVAAPFKVITNARDAAVELIRMRFAAGEPIRGCDVDRVCRTVVEGAGMGAAFIHRTGHNITTEVHGPGANMDDFETHDTRRILPGTTFSIEPGVYFPERLGLRTEIDVIIEHDGTVTIPSAPVQVAVLPLLAENWIE